SATAPESDQIFTTDPDIVCRAADPGLVLGIDLGTSNAVVAVLRAGRVEVIPNQEGERLTPSVVAFTAQGEILIGATALRQAAGTPQRTIASIKRYLGRPAANLAAVRARLPQKVGVDPLETARGPSDGRAYTPVEISALILKKLKSAAETYLGHEVRR